MSSGRLTKQPEENDDNPEYSSNFPHHSEHKLSIFEAIPIKINKSFTIQNTYFSSSCVTTCSKVVIIVSLIFAVVQLALFGCIVYSFYGTLGMLIASSVIFVLLIAGERYRIIWSVSWWRSFGQTEAKAHRVYEGTLNWTRSMTYLIVFLIVPIWLASLFYELMFGDLYDSELKESRILFVVITGVDVLIFIPFCACPISIYAACFWKRVITEEERVESLQEIGA